MALPLSHVGFNDKLIVGDTAAGGSKRSLLLKAPFNRWSRHLLIHVIANRLPAIQKPRSRLQGEIVEESELTAGGVSQLHAVCLDCFSVFNQSKILFGSWHHLVPRCEKYFLHHQFSALKAAAERGCHFCSILLDAYQGLTTPPQHDDGVYLQIVKVYKCEIELYVTIAPRLGLYKMGLLPRYAGMKFDTSVSQGWFKSWSAKSTPHECQWCNSTGSGQHVRLAKYWVSECTEKHQTCRIQGETSIIAARYIKIREPSGGTGVETQLHLTTDEDIVRPYCALSHCWGGASDILILKTSNIKELMVMIDSTALAKSFQDAITITHALGIEFLWIDCLCIIQDSKEDWLRESMRMGHIYEGATCTIMSAAARDPHGGLFQTRNPLAYSPFRLCGLGSDETFVMPQGSKGKLEEVLKDAPLQKRAWTFQESYLSPRKLYFGPNGMYWSCFSGEATEIDPNGKVKRKANDLPLAEIETIFGASVLVERSEISADHPFMLDDNIIASVEHGHSLVFPSEGDFFIEGNISMKHGKLPRKSPDIIENNQFWLNRTTGSNLSLDGFHSEWFDIVGDYSGRALTRPEDKLVALSGIATRISNDTGYHYLSGLWKETLLLDLLWHIQFDSHPEPLKPRYPSKLAPSWSWASVEGRVRSSLQQPDLASVPLVEVTLEALATSTSNSQQDAAGVDLGALVLRGKLKKVSALRVEYATRTRRAHVYSGEILLGWIDYDVLPSRYAQNDTYILPILEDMDWSISHYPAIHGIALVSKHDHLLHFERVGLFICAMLSKRDELADYYLWFHEGEDQDIYIS